MIINFVSSIFGQLLVNRIFSDISSEFLLSSHQSKQIQRTIFVILAAQTYLLRSSQIKHWLFIGILLISLKFFPRIFNFFLEKRFKNNVVRLLDELILEMKMGRSFRFSLKIIAEKTSGWMGHQIKIIVQNLEKDEPSISVKSASVADFERMISLIDKSNSKNLDRVIGLRNHYKMLQNFRRRSGQVSAQIRMQAIIVTILYLSLLTFVIVQFGFMKQQKLIFCSISMFLLGLFVIFYVGRKLKWKV